MATANSSPHTSEPAVPRWSNLLAISLTVLLTCVAVGNEMPPPQPHTSGEKPMENTSINDGRHDFDFLRGTYQIHNRRLSRRLQGDDTWQEFSATSTVHTILGGLGNQDEYRTEFWPGFVGMSFRFFDPEKRLWAIYWADNHQGVLQPPVYGRFEGPVGVFEGDDTYAGQPIRVRFTWTLLGDNRARWEQAFSPDGGQTWEKNWTMDLSR